MHPIYNAYNKLIYSTKNTTFIHKMATNQAKLYNVTAINCLCAGFVFFSIFGSYVNHAGNFKSYVAHSIELR